MDKWVSLSSNKYKGTEKRSVWLSEAGTCSPSYSDNDLQDQMCIRDRLIGMHAQRSKYKPHSATLSQKEIDKKLTGYFATHTVLTRSDMQSLCQFTHSMAARHIRRLKEEGSLQNIGIRTQPIYVPCPGHYGK